MSVISGHSNISSILKTPVHNRSSLLAQSSNRVRFQTPKASNIEETLRNYINGESVRQYEELLCCLRETDLKDDELLSFVSASRECISLLGRDVRLYVEGILKLNWSSRNEHILSTYKTFLLELLTAHNYHVPLAMEKLVICFTSEGCWLNGKPTELGLNIFTSIHEVLEKILIVVPMSCNFLLQAIISLYPYYKKSEDNESYIYNVLWILRYKPELRSELLMLIINKLILLDVNAPKSDIVDCDISDDDDDESHFKMEIDDTNCTQMKHPIANTLDCCMIQLFQYIRAECYEDDSLNYKNTEKLYKDMIIIFEKVILPTYAIHHVQFVMFYLCSFKLILAEAFLNFLWRKVTNPNIALIHRQVSVCYIASLLARAKFIPLSMLKAMLSELSNWLQHYISRQDSIVNTHRSGNTRGGIAAHGVFYTIAQALFYVIAFRHTDLTKSRKNLIFLQSLNLTKLVTCPLNPLRYCLPIVVQNFAAVTRAEQLVYCYTIMERNDRNNMAVLYGDHQVVKAHESLETFFPFDPYVLKRSGVILEDIYLQYRSSLSESRVEEPLPDVPFEEDDFLSDQLNEGECFSRKSQKHTDKFSYGSSPGFKT